MPRPRTTNQGHSDGPALRRVAGHPALDFVNTVDHDRPNPETLARYGDLVAWCSDADVLTLSEARRLRTIARSDRSAAETWLGAAIALREAARRLLAARIRRRRASKADVDALNSMIRRFDGPRQLAPSHLGYLRGRTGADAELGEPVRRLLESTVGFLTSRDFDHVRVCEGADCGWFFIDRSPSRRRRWCSMAACGNREKAHRHYSHKKQAARA